MNTESVNTIQMNNLKAVVESSSTEKAMMTYFAKRDRHTDSLPVSVLKRTLMIDNPATPIIEEDLYKGLKKLEKDGLGVLVYGKNGEQDVWKWGNYHIKVTRFAFPKDELKNILKAHRKERAKVLADRYKKEGRLEAKIKGPGRPKGSKNKPKDLITKSIQVMMDKRLVAIPLKGNRDIRIEIPTNVSQDELALLTLTLQEIIA